MFRDRQRACAAVEAPKPFGPIPSARQLRWHQREFYGFLHFTINTFTGQEWGYGDESPDVFAPQAFDADQIATAAVQGGMRGLILTCKHHDGFCLWPSRFTEHSVKNSPWRQGRGDVVREVSRACAAQGLEFGVYLSPWDRNHAEYGRPAYLHYYREQLRELLSEYGPIFEVWFDGANGGDGYYGGARECRQIDRHTYYDWENTWRIVRELQPAACMFSDAGPDVRWVGNEKGIAADPCWHTLDRRRFVPGDADLKLLNTGQRHGPDWLPAECDVSIRPGWFYHAAEDDKVRDPQNLVRLYFKSVGRGANLLLNLPPDTRGQIPRPDACALQGFRDRLREIFDVNLAPQARAIANNTRGNSPAFAAANLLDDNPETYWATDDGLTKAEVELQFPEPILFNVLRLREFLPLGQRIERWAVDVDSEGRWVQYAAAAGIGCRRLIHGPDCRTRRLRLRLHDSPISPALAEMAVFFGPVNHWEPD